VTFYNRTRGLVNTIRQSLINWALLTGYFGSLGRALVVVAIVERWPLERAYNESECMDCPLGPKRVAAVERWSL